MGRAGYDTAGSSGKAKPVPSNVVHRFYDFIHLEEAAPIQLKEFATELRIFSAASNTLNDYLWKLEINPKDDVETLKDISVDCRLCAQRCETLVMNFFAELDIFAGKVERLGSSQSYHFWEMDTVRERECMKKLTAAINLHLSPTYSSEITATELVPIVHPPAAINTVAQPYSTQDGSVGIFFKSCADLFLALTREACFLDQLQEKHKLAFRELYGKFYFGGTGSLAGQGELDKVLGVSARLKDQTTSLLVQIAKILCSEETGLFHVIDKAAIGRTLSGQRQRLLSLLDSFETKSYQSEDSDTDSIISGDDDAVFAIEIVLHDLATFVGCLTKLGFSLDHPAPDPAPAPDKTNTPSSSLTGSATDSIMHIVGHFPATNILSTLQPDPMDRVKESKHPWEDDDDSYQYRLMSDKITGFNAPTRDYSNRNADGKRIQPLPYSDNLHAAAYPSSFGFSLSDVKFALDLSKFIYEKCFTKANRADVRYFEFGQDIQTLAHSLQQLIEVTENAWEQRQSRPLQPWAARQVEQRGPEAELESLREVTGDFSKTLKDCIDLLGNHHKFHRNQAGFVDNVFWHASTESEVIKLKERVRLHITKMSFVIKPFEIQLLMGIRTELIQLQQDVRDLAGLMITLHQDTTRDSALPSLPSVEMDLTPDAITKRFVAALDLNRPKAFHEVSDFPLKEGFDALVFHFANSTVLFNPGVGPSQKVPKETQYLNLLKAKWILEKLKASSELAATETNSLWFNCEREVELEVIKQCRRFGTNGLKPPPLDNITRLPDECFTIWIFEAPSLQPRLAEARALEEKILVLTLPNNSTLTIFRISDDNFRVVTVHTTVIPDKSKEVERESFPANMQSTRLVPTYATPEAISGSSLSGNGILLYRQAQDFAHWQHLEGLMDVFSFQQALTGYRVYFDASNVKWSLNGSVKPGRYGMARVQLWEAKRLTKLPIAEDTDQSPLSSVNSSTPSPQAVSENGFGKRRSTGSASTITSSSRTTLIAGNRACNAIVIPPPEPPVLIMYTSCDSKFTFLHLTLGKEIFVNESACLCKKSPEKCQRIVLGSKNKKIKFRKYSTLEPGSGGLHSWDLALFRIPRHPRYKEIEVVEKNYICLDFQTNAAKAQFRHELRTLFESVRDSDIKNYRMEINKLEINSHRPGGRLPS